LTEIQFDFQQRQSTTLSQVEEEQHRFDTDGALRRMEAAAQQGLQAENERKVEEIYFSLNFTKEVIAIDVEFGDTVRQHSRERQRRVDRIRDCRKKQREILRSLVEVMDDREKDDKRLPGGVSFLAVRSTIGKSVPDAGFLNKLQEALHSGADQHTILMQVKGLLGVAAPVDASGVQSLVDELGAALKAERNELAKFEEQKRRCQTEGFHAVQGQQELVANLALMSATRKHTESALVVARKNLASVDEKIATLQRSPSDFSRLVTHLVKVWDAEDKDRTTVVTAISKANTVVASVLPDEPAALALLRNLREELDDQKTQAEAFKAEQLHFQRQFARYVDRYLNLLEHQQKHYENALSSLELYVNELSNDMVSQSETLATSESLKHESGDICGAIMRNHDSHKKQRLDISAELKKSLPHILDVFGGGERTQ